MYVKYFVYSKCSIVTGCIVIITITWNLVTSCECLFSLLSHTWKGASENQNVMCKYGPRFSNFFFFICQARLNSFTFLLTRMTISHLPSNSSQTSITSFPLSLSGDSLSSFCWGNRSNKKWIPRSSHHHIYSYHILCLNVAKRVELFFSTFLFKFVS